MQKFLKYILRYWYLYAVALACMIIHVSLDMLSPQVTKKIIDDVLGKGQLGILAPLLLMIFVIGAGRCVFGYAKEFIFDKASSQIGTDIRRDLFKHIQGLSVDYFDKTNTGELMARVKDDVDRIWDATGYVGMLVVEVVIHTAIVLFCMFRLSRRLFIIPVIAMPVVAVFAIVMERRLDKVYMEISEENAVLNTVAQEDIAGIHTVKAFAREKFEIKKFLSHNKRYYDLNMQQSKVLIKYQPLFKLFTQFLPLIAVIYGGFLVIRGEMSLGTLGAFAEYCTNIVWPMEMLGWLLNDVAAAMASNKKLRKIYAQTSSVSEPKAPLHPEHIQGDIRFEHVSWTVDGQDILKDVSFHVRPGETLGIMGATGAGKTTVIELMQRFYDVSGGKIRLDGMDIKALPLHTLRRAIAPVMQDVFLFSDTIAANVSMGCETQPEAAVIGRAIEDACAAGFVSRLEQRYDTVIGERGVGLSGGQKQRISMARALVRNAPVLVLDDATSALDMETESQIQDTLKKHSGQTKIIIAHRISAVCNAQQIIVLDKGRIIEAGTHKALMAQKGYYYKTYQAQYGDIIGEEAVSCR